LALLFKIVFALVFIVVLISLGYALFFLTTEQGKNSTKMVTALKIRIGLSLFLIVLLVFGYFTGLIQPRIH